jgi:hypothetical protein
MTGKPKMLQSYLEDGTNRAQLETLLGKEGLDNLKQLTVLMSNAKTARALQDTGRNIVSEFLSQRYAHIPGGVLGLFGATVGHMMGIPWYTGLGAGATAAMGIRMVLRDASTNPRIGNMIESAVRNGISPKIYAPLIARVIAQQAGVMTPDQTKP